MFENEKGEKEWRDGTYLTTVSDSLQADILESKLRSEGIPVQKKYKGSSNYMEIFMGKDFTFPIELYVPKECLEDAQNVIVPVPLTDEEYDEAMREAGEGAGQETED